MAMNYAIGNGQGPGKSKKLKRTGPAPAGRKEGEESKERRMSAFNSAKDKKKVATVMSINNKTQKAVDEGLELNEYGAPKGNQQHKKYKSLFKGLNPKFSKSK